MGFPVQARFLSFGAHTFPHQQRPDRVAGRFFAARAVTRPPRLVSLIQPKCADFIHGRTHCAPQQLPYPRSLSPFLSACQHRGPCPHLALRLASPVYQRKPVSPPSIPRSRAEMCAPSSRATRIRASSRGPTEAWVVQTAPVQLPAPAADIQTSREARNARVTSARWAWWALVSLATVASSGGSLLCEARDCVIGCLVLVP